MFLVEPKIACSKISGDNFFINDKDVGHWMCFSGIAELPIIEWCKENFINENSTFVDIGAHIGTYTWILGDKAKHTYSFECNKEVYNCLCANIYLKNLSNKIDTYNIGLSSEEKELKYYIRSNDGGGNGVENIGHENKHITVQVNKLDNYNINNISFIKIDVEGHELDVLKGSIETLKRNNYPPFLFESWGEQRGSEKYKFRKPLFDYIRNELGYEIIMVGNTDEIFLAVKNNK